VPVAGRVGKRGKIGTGELSQKLSNLGENITETLEVTVGYYRRSRI
jgi:hypothetical protein